MNDAFYFNTLQFRSRKTESLFIPRFLKEYIYIKLQLIESK